MSVQEFEVVPEKTDLAIAEPQDKWERLLQVAVERKAGAEQFAMLVDAITKARREDARLHFEAALGRFKKHLPAVFKSKKVTFPTKDGGQTGYSHAELDKAAEVCAEELGVEGITFNWRPGSAENGRTKMTCVFRHPESGHVEDMATLDGPPDTSGSKNNLQAIGSTVSYLQRYSLLAACGIVAQGMDNDGRTPTEGMPENSITDYCIALRDASDIGELKKIFTDCYRKSQTLADKDAEKRFIKVYEERKKSLRQPQ